MSTVENNKRLVKNTLFLSFRMMLTMGVSIFTVRIVLDTLGVQDYGIYNVVGSVVTAFSFLSATMASASQRFFSYELARKDYKKLSNLFSLTVVIYVGLAIVIFILAETVGLWFLNSQLNFPEDRMLAVNWVYQFSIFAFVMSIMTVPYEAALFAREKMVVYAYVSIVEVLLKLVVIYILVIFSFDKLKLYALLIFLIQTIVTFIYRIYCKTKFEECRFHFYWNKEEFKILLGYSGWNLFGSLTYVSLDQGINLLLNMFFGPIVNASRAIAFQVNNAISSFSSNFYTAVRPQIIKSYAEDNKIFMMELVFKSTKYSFFILMLLSTPILLETNYILKLWLKTIPTQANSLVQLTIIFTLINSLHIPLSTAVQATGEIKKYQVTIGSIMLICLPISYIFLKYGFAAETPFCVLIVGSCVALYFRLRILRELIHFNYLDYFKQVLFKITFVFIATYAVTLMVVQSINEGITRFFIVCITSVVISALSIYLFGLDKNEKIFSVNIIKNFCLKFFSKRN